MSRLRCALFLALLFVVLSRGTRSSAFAWSSSEFSCSNTVAKSVQELPWWVKAIGLLRFLYFAGHSWLGSESNEVARWADSFGGTWYTIRELFPVQARKSCRRFAVLCPEQSDPPSAGLSWLAAESRRCCLNGCVEGRPDSGLAGTNWSDDFTPAELTLLRAGGGYFRSVRITHLSSKLVSGVVGVRAHEITTEVADGKVLGMSEAWRTRLRCETRDPRTGRLLRLQDILDRRHAKAATNYGRRLYSLYREMIFPSLFLPSKHAFLVLGEAREVAICLESAGNYIAVFPLGYLANLPATSRDQVRPLPTLSARAYRQAMLEEP